MYGQHRRPFFSPPRISSSYLICLAIIGALDGGSCMVMATRFCLGHREISGQVIRDLQASLQQNTRGRRYGGSQPDTVRLPGVIPALSILAEPITCRQSCLHTLRIVWHMMRPHRRRLGQRYITRLSQRGVNSFCIVQYDSVFRRAKEWAAGYQHFVTQRCQHASELFAETQARISSGII